MAAIDQRGPQSIAPFTQKQKKKLPITAIYNKMAVTFGYSHSTSAIRNSASSLGSSEVEEDDDEDEGQGQQGADKDFNGTHTFGSCHTTSLYSLTSGSLTRGSVCSPSTTSSSSSERREHHRRLLNSSASDSLSSSFATESLGEERDSPVSLIHPADHMKTLLAQMRSSISASNAAFKLIRASSNPCVSAENVYGGAEKAMLEELETLSNLHMRLYTLIQEHDFGMKQADSSYESSSNDSMAQNTGNVQRQDAMLKSYEGIISRFHDEIRKKDAVTEALKETLAKSMLKGEKLERRMKALEGKLSRVQLK